MSGKYDLLENLNVDAEKIMCKTCKYKNSGVRIHRGEAQYTMCFCEKYIYPNTKPVKVLFENARCHFYEKE